MERIDKILGIGTLIGAICLAGYPYYKDFQEKRIEAIMKAEAEEYIDKESHFDVNPSEKLDMKLPQIKGIQIEAVSWQPIDITSIIEKLEKRPDLYEHDQRWVPVSFKDVYKNKEKRYMLEELIERNIVPCFANTQEEKVYSLVLGDNMLIDTPHNLDVRTENIHDNDVVGYWIGRKDGSKLFIFADLKNKRKVLFRPENGCKNTPLYDLSDNFIISPDGSKLFLQWYSDPDYGIYRLDTSDMQLLSKYKGYNIEALSSDGSVGVVSHHRVDFDTGKEEFLADHKYSRWFDISPNGKLIACQTEKFGPSFVEIYIGSERVRNIGGSGRSELKCVKDGEIHLMDGTIFYFPETK